MKYRLFALLLTLAMFLPTLAACAPNSPDVPSDSTDGTDSVGSSTTDDFVQTDETDEPIIDDGRVYHIIPRCTWGYATKETPADLKLGDMIIGYSMIPMDLSTYKYIEFDLYLEGANKLGQLTGNTQFELTSGGGCDVEEYTYRGNSFLSGQTLVDGWNHVKIALPTAWGDCDPTRVDFMRWYFVEPKQSISAKIANFRFTNDESVEPAVVGLDKTKVFLPETKYTPKGTIVALADVTKSPYNADKTGKKDCTSALNLALSDASAAGGGTIYLPAGQYLITGTVYVPLNCTLQGDWQDPDVGTDYGTIILAKPKENSKNPTFRLSGSAGVNGLTVYYPEQSLTDVKKYPFTFYTTGLGSDYMLASVTNCTVIGAYQGIGACVYETNAHEMFSIENVKGTFLRTAAEVYNQADVGTWKSVTVSPDYWANCPLGTAPGREEIADYTRKNTVGLILGDLEWTQFANLTVTDCKYGVHIVDGKRIDFAGSFFNCSLTNCNVALRVAHIDDRWGMTVANCTLSGSQYSIENRSGGIVKLYGCTLTGKTGGSGQITKTTQELDYIATPNYTLNIIPKTDKLYIYTGISGGEEDCSAELQAMLDKAGKTGGIVYLPGGVYRLNRAITVPKNVQLRGCVGSPSRNGGTMLISYYGNTNRVLPNTDPALITLAEGSGVVGIRIVFPKNGPKGVSKTVYAIRGEGKNVYCVNSSIVAAANGIDFKDCDGYHIKKVITGCYENTFRVGGKGGVIEGCLQNGTVVSRSDGELVDYLKNWCSDGELNDHLFPKTRSNLRYITVAGGEDQIIYNTFAYGCHTFVTQTAGEKTSVISIGADNIGGSLIEMKKGSLYALGLMRYNASSYVHSGGTFQMFLRLSIGEKNEQNYKKTK